MNVNHLYADTRYVMTDKVCKCPNRNTPSNLIIGELPQLWSIQCGRVFIHENEEFAGDLIRISAICTSSLICVTSTAIV